MAKKSEAPATSPELEAAPTLMGPPKQWDTTLKLGSIEEATYASLGAVVVAINKTSGEVTLRHLAETQPHGRSREVVE